MHRLRDWHVRARQKNIEETAIETTAAARSVAETFLQAVIQLLVDFTRD